MPFDGPLPSWIRPTPQEPKLTLRDKLVAVGIALLLSSFAIADSWLLLRYIASR
jgi:hypothetical protein